MFTISVSIRSPLVPLGLTSLDVNLLDIDNFFNKLKKLLTQHPAKEESIFNQTLGNSRYFLQIVTNPANLIAACKVFPNQKHFLFEKSDPLLFTMMDIDNLRTICQIFPEKYEFFFNQTLKKEEGLSKLIDLQSLHFACDIFPDKKRFLLKKTLLNPEKFSVFIKNEAELFVAKTLYFSDIQCLQVETVQEAVSEVNKLRSKTQIETMSMRLNKWKDQMKHPFFSQCPTEILAKIASYANIDDAYCEQEAYEIAYQTMQKLAK